MAAARGISPGGGPWPGETMSRGDGTLLDADLQPKQELLRPLRWLLRPDSERFAHPAEVELSRLLSFYGIRWAYEPTTFAVRWTADGHPAEFVTPDFYLPDHDLYLELTTMRQRLVTRKNRKFRMLRERYPNVRVRVLYLRDFERLRDANDPELAGRKGNLRSTLVTARDLERRISELASHLIADWREQELMQRPLLLGMGGGAGRFLLTLRERVHEQGAAVDVDRIELTSLIDQPSGTRARIVRPPALPVAGRPVLVVQEVLSTGLSAAFVENWLRRQGATAVGVCALLDREAARILDVSLVCHGFPVPDLSVAGYGLRRWHEFRELPFIAVVEPGE